MVEGEGEDQLWGSGRIAGCQGAIVGGRGGRRPTFGERTWCHCWVPLQGAIVVCCGGGGGGAIPGCHCSVLDGWRPTLREWTWCDCWVQ